MDKKEDKTVENNFPPVVSVLGHVDHGKTTLLDSIRKTSIAQKERGGITQRIGASQIEIKHDGAIRKITFIDTPGHEAFENMRSHGVNAADIALLVVASDDGVMPQTRESITKIKDAKIPFIVVFTKIDLETANLERARQQILKEEILLEGFGGDVPSVGISARTGDKVADLLDLIILVYDLSGIKKDKNGDFLGVVIDSKQDKRRGVVASVIIKNGTFRVGEKLFDANDEVGKIKAIIDVYGKNTKEVFPGDACEILGLAGVLSAGSLLYNKPSIASHKIVEVAKRAPMSIDIAKFLGEEENDLVPIVLKTETAAELEAVKNSLPSDIKIIFQGQGDISSSDILLAKEFKALVLGFSVSIAPDAKRMATSEKVFYKQYAIIYELIEELAVLVEELKNKGKETALGKGIILEKFEGTKGIILGVRIDEGRLRLSDNVRIVRKEKILGVSKIASIKRGKEDVKESGKNTECGIMIKPQVDFEKGDAIIAYKS